MTVVDQHELKILVVVAIGAEPGLALAARNHRLVVGGTWGALPAAG
jgi:hypothetical protein